MKVGIKVGRRAVRVVIGAVCAAGVIGSGIHASGAPPTEPPTGPDTTPPPAATGPAPSATATTVPPPPPPTSTIATTTTLPAPPDWVENPACVWVVRPGDSVFLIGASLRPAVAASTLLRENTITEAALIRPGELLDVCPDNDTDDVTGASRARPDTTLISDHDWEAVQRQQHKLNELFEPFGIRSLAGDGISGPLTRQQLCAARVLLGLPVSRSDMAVGSAEEAELLALPSAPIPPGAPRRGSKWVLIDMTCQVLFAGDRNGLTFVFPTSTGETGFETRVVGEADAFRFDPAVENGGWHDSTEYPSSFDNPLNGNMYKPLYFHNGQAIHGANNVPTSPASKGCARLRLEHHDLLIGWLGLGDATDVVWSESRIGLTVSTQGTFKPDP